MCNESLVFIGNLTGLINNLPLPATSSVKKKGESFDEIPIRRLDVLQPLSSSLLATGYFGDERQELVPFVMTTQFSLPSSLSAGDFKWSILRFIILSKISLNPSSPSPSIQYFDVTVSDFDVGT